MHLDFCSKADLFRLARFLLELEALATAATTLQHIILHVTENLLTRNWLKII